MATIKSALTISDVPIDAFCIGTKWIASDKSQIAKLIAIIAMGQAMHASDVIQNLIDVPPPITHTSLKKAAKGTLEIGGKTESEIEAARYRRDGFIFEAISWIAARQTSGKNTYLKDPHLKSTTQGLDGLMIEMDNTKTEVINATIFEDKCSKNPRAKFRDEILPGFKQHHQNLRSPELVSIAASLIEKSGIGAKETMKAASFVLDLARRKYRAALVISDANDDQTYRKALFKNYHELDNISANQRIGATFIIDQNLRDWFDHIAELATHYIDELSEEIENV